MTHATCRVVCAGPMCTCVCRALTSRMSALWCTTASPKQLRSADCNLSIGCSTAQMLMHTLLNETVSPVCQAMAVPSASQAPTMLTGSHQWCAVGMLTAAAGYCGDDHALRCMTTGLLSGGGQSRQGRQAQRVHTAVRAAGHPAHREAAALRARALQGQVDRGFALLNQVCPLQRCNSPCMRGNRMRRIVESTPAFCIHCGHGPFRQMLLTS